MCDEDKQMKRQIPPKPQIVAANPDGTSPTRWQLERIVGELRTSPAALVESGQSYDSRIAAAVRAAALRLSRSRRARRLAFKC
jgi:hypothetical protein